MIDSYSQVFANAYIFSLENSEKELAFYKFVSVNFEPCIKVYRRSFVRGGYFKSAFRGPLGCQ
jgi:hypothetical protein